MDSRNPPLLGAGIPLTPPFGSAALWRAFRPDPLNKWYERCITRLLGLTNEQLAKYDLGELNLLLAFGLPGAQRLDFARYLDQLDDWTEAVRRETARCWPRFQRSPHEFQYSEARFRMMVMVAVLQRDLGAHYNARARDGIYDTSDSRTDFIHGLLDGHGGACVSMPMLDVTIGRRLGFPLKLARAWGHSYVVWNGADGERFNVEATSQGCVFRDDDHYAHWPRRVTAEEIAKGNLLTPLSPRQQLAAMLVARGTCWRDNRRFMAAVNECFWAQKLDPNNKAISGDHARTTVLACHDSGEIDYGLDDDHPRDYVVDHGTRRPPLAWEARRAPLRARRLEAAEGHPRRTACQCRQPRLVHVARRAAGGPGPHATQMVKKGTR